jgi:WD40 repeat protein
MERVGGPTYTTITDARAAQQHQRLAQQHSGSAAERGKLGALLEKKLVRKTFPQCLHYWRDETADMLAVGDDAGQVFVFRPPDPTMTYPRADLVGMVEHHASGWGTQQVVAWATSLKLGDDLIGRFDKYEVTGSDLLSLVTDAKEMHPMFYPEGTEKLQSQHMAALLRSKFEVGRVQGRHVNALIKGIEKLESVAPPLHEDWVTKLLYLAAPWECLLSASKDNTLKVTDLHREPFDDPGAVGGLPAGDRVDDIICRLRKILNDRGRKHTKGIFDFAWCESFKMIATCGIEREIHLWNPYGIHLGQLGPLAASTRSVVMNESLNQLISLSTDNVLKVWDVSTNKCVQTIDHKLAVGEYQAVQAAHYERRSVSTVQSHQEQLQEEAVSGRVMRGGGPPDENMVCSLSYFPDTGHLVTSTTKLVMWQTRRTAVTSRTVRSHGAPVSCCMYNPYMQQVVSCDETNVYVWDFETGNLSYRIDEAHGSNKILAMAFDGDGACLLTSGHDGRVKIWNLSNGKLLSELVRPSTLDNDLRETTALLYYTATVGRFVISGGWDHKISVWVDEGTHDNQDGVIPKQSVHHQMQGHACGIRCLALLRPPMLASGSDDGEIILWNMESGFAKYKLSDMALKRTALQTPNTKFFSATSSIAVESMTFIPDSGVVIAAYGDGWLRFWDCARGVLLHRHRAEVRSGHPPTALALCPALTADERQVLMVGDAGGAVQVWDVTPWADPQLTGALEGLGARLEEPETVAHPLALRIMWQAHVLGQTVSSLSFISRQSSEPLLLTAGADGDVTLWSIGANIGAEMAIFRAEHDTPWVLDNFTAGCKTLVTTAMVGEFQRRYAQMHSHQPETGKLSARESRQPMVNLNQAEDSAAQLSSPPDGPGDEQAASSQEAPTAAEAAGDASTDVTPGHGHDADALEVFASLAPPATGSGVRVQGRLAMGPAGGFEAGSLQPQHHPQTDSVESAATGLLTNRGLAPSVIQSFRRPRGVQRCACGCGWS